MPQKPVKTKNLVLGSEQIVKGPDMPLDHVCSYRLNYFKCLTQRPNPFNKRNSDVQDRREIKVMSQMIGRSDPNYDKIREGSEGKSAYKSSSPTMLLQQKYSVMSKRTG